MDSYWVYACSQHPCESTYEYFERYKCYLDEYPDHGLQLHELITDFLDGMLNEECYTLYLMAGKHLTECTPRELWLLIQERAAATKPYMEYNSEQPFEEMLCEVTKQASQPKASEFTMLLAEFGKKLLELERKLGERAKNQHESIPDNIELFVDEEEVLLLARNQNDKDMEDAELQVVPIKCTENIMEEEWISPQCSDISIEQNGVITCNTLIIPTSSFSYHVQNDAIPKAVRNKQVWSSLTRIEIHTPKVWNLKPILKSAKFLNNLCIKWKTREKSKGMMLSSLRKSDIHSHCDRTLRPALTPMKLHPSWKKRKKGKCFIRNSEFSMLSVHVQKKRASFGWKPGWTSWKKASHKMVTKNMGFWTVGGNSVIQHYCPNLTVRKFDGTHPWAPNI